MNKIKVIVIIIILLCSYNKALYGKTIEEIISYSLIYNTDINLEKARLDKSYANKGDGIIGFLPQLQASHKVGRKKDDALGIERSNDLDKMSDQNINSINFTQPIFAGFKNYHKLKEIKYVIKQAESYYQQVRNEILLSAIDTYLNLYKLRKILTFNKHNIKLHQELFKLIKERNNLGAIDNSEVIIYEERLFNILLKKMEIKTELFKAEREYEHIIGGLDFDLKLDKLTIANFPINEADLLKESLANNPNLKQYKYKINSLKQILKQKKGEFSPQVNFVADISKQESVTYLNNRDLRTESFSFNFSIPLFQKGREYVNLKKARKELSFAKHEYNKNINDFVKDVKKTYREYNFYSEMINENKILINFTINKISSLSKKVKLGMGDRLDLLTTKLELNSLQEQQLDNQISYYNNYYKILSYLNKLTEENV